MLQRVCRTCASLDESGMIFVFENVNLTSEFQIADELELLNVDIEKDDGLPQQICRNCFKQLVNIYKFRQLCKNSQDQLEEYFKINDEKRAQEEIENDNSMVEIFDLNSGKILLENIITENFQNSNTEIDSNHDDIMINSNDDSLYDQLIKLNTLVLEPIYENEPSISCELPQTNVNENWKADSEEMENIQNADDTPLLEINKSSEISTNNNSENILENHNNEQFGVANDDDITSMKITKCSTCKKYFHQSRYDIHKKICCTLKNIDDFLMQSSLDLEFSCFYCNEEFESLETIENHIFEKHPKDNPFTCEYCDEKFTLLSKKKYHVELKHDSNIYKCDICAKSFKKQRYLVKHKKSIHTNGFHKCNICLKIYNTEAKLKYHLEIHDSNKKLKCKYCDKLFLRQQHLKYHEEIHTNVDNPYKCQICNKNFIHQYYYKIHLKKHNNENELYRCVLCGKEFVLQCLLNSHVKNNHHKTLYQSEISKNSFKPSLSLTTHCENTNSVNSNNMSQIRTVPEIEKESSPKNQSISYQTKTNYTCEICSKSFLIPSSLKRHLKVHDKNREFPCNLCQNSYKKASHLKNHINRKHLKTKKFKCPYCDKIFFDSSTRTIHAKGHFIRKNVENKKQKCKFCDKELSFHYLKYHELSHINGGYSCLVCGKVFKQYYSYRNHYKKHSKRMKKDVLDTNGNLLS